MVSYASLSLYLVLGAAMSATEGASVAQAGETLDANRLEAGMVPIISYDSNLGLGLGALVALTQFDPDHEPHRWRLQALALVSVRATGDGDLQVPVQSYSVDLDLPEIAPRLRARARVGFFLQENVNYFGLGNRSTRFEDSPEEFHQYERMSPSLSGLLRYRLVGFPRRRLRLGRLELFGGLDASYSKLQLLRDSLLRDHAARAASPQNPDDEVFQDLIHGTQDHFLILARAGLLLDLRDNEFHPETGSLSTIGLRWSPGVDASLDYLGLSASTAWFFQVIPGYLVVATRVAGDLIVGDAPFYDLATFGSFQTTEGPGGADSVRGLLLRRFHGKAKIVANLELRTEFLHFRAFDSPFTLGALVFSDAGQVWADIRSRSVGDERLDGGLGEMQVGLGGGLRLRWGDTFIIRADYGISPTDDTTGLYISINHIF